MKKLFFTNLEERNNIFLFLIDSYYIFLHDDIRVLYIIM
jgi:hypothetical protein